MQVMGIFLSFINFGFFLGWLFLPRITVAILATNFYWHTNPFLCIMAWIWAVVGEGIEKLRLLISD